MRLEFFLSQKHEGLSEKVNSLKQNYLISNGCGTSNELSCDSQKIISSGFEEETTGIIFFKLYTAAPSLGVRVILENPNASQKNFYGFLFLRFSTEAKHPINYTCFKHNTNYFNCLLLHQTLKNAHFYNTNHFDALLSLIKTYLVNMLYFYHSKD